jgi:hypothetical protein
MSLATAQLLPDAEDQGHDRTETEQEIGNPLDDAVAYLEAQFDAINTSIKAARAGEATHQHWQVLRDRITHLVLPTSKPVLIDRDQPTLLMAFAGTRQEFNNFLDRARPETGETRQ